MHKHAWVTRVTGPRELVLTPRRVKMSSDCRARCDGMTLTTTGHGHCAGSADDRGGAQPPARLERPPVARLERWRIGGRGGGGRGRASGLERMVVRCVCSTLEISDDSRYSRMRASRSCLASAVPAMVTWRLVLHAAEEPEKRRETGVSLRSVRGNFGECAPAGQHQHPRGYALSFCSQARTAARTACTRTCLGWRGAEG